MQRKLLLLLAYLALEGPKDRPHLQRLFWPDASDAAGNLRVALRRLRAGAPDALALDGPRVAATVPTDARALLAASETGEHERVVELYRGRFLEGAEPPGWSPELEEWAYRTREVLAARVRQARLHLAEAAAARGQERAAVAHAEAAYLLPGAPEPEAEELGRLYLLLRAGHSPLAAEVRREAEPYGLNLPPGAVDAREALRPPTAPPNPSSGLPTFGTSFLGRQAEEGAVARLLADPGCRLLTVVGPGGMGKTRLAVQVAAGLPETGAFPDGVFFVNLAPVTSPAHLPLVIAEVLGLGLDGPEEPLTQVMRGLAQGRRLLVLDNLEHLIDAAGALVALLEACPHVKLLVTSRERLNVQEEWVLPLEGLATPPPDTPAQGEERWPAPLLFLQRARRGGPGFSPGPEDLAGVLDICRRVGGSPLAIELAASWTRALSVDEILQELRRSPDFLTDVNGRGPARHASLRAVFEHSWRLLDTREQGALARLSVFRSPFRREAAAEVAGTSLPLLAALIDKSLLRRLPGGLYGRHPLLYEYTREKLAESPDEEDAVGEAHARFFLRLLAASGDALAGAGQRSALRDLETQVENVRAAWTWATGRAAVTALCVAARPLRLFFDVSGRYREGLDLLAGTVQHLEEAGNVPTELLGELHVHQAVLQLRLGALHGAGDSVRRGLALLGDGGGEAVVEGLDVRAVLDLRAGRYEEARRSWEAALEHAGGREDPLTARLWGRLGIAEQWLGHYPEAEAWYRRALGLARALGRPADVTRMLNNLASLFITAGRFGEARALLEEGLAQARELALGQATVHFLNNLAVVHGALGEPGRARAHGEEALALVRGLGNPSLEAEVLETLGRLNLAAGRLEEARAHFAESLRLAWGLRQWLVVLQGLEGLAEIGAREDQAGWAAPLLRLVACHPAASRELVSRAQEALGTLPPDLVAGLPAVDPARLEGTVVEAVEGILGPRLSPVVRE